MDAKKGSISIAVVCLALGFLAAVELRSANRIDSSMQAAQNTRAETLQIALTNEKQKNEALYNQLMQYKDEMVKFRDEASQSGDYAELLLEQLKKAEMMAGEVDVEGPGIIVTMSDKSRSVAEGSEESSFLIHHSDIIAVVNELFTSGAEAVSVNGERVIARTAIFRRGSTMTINGNVYTSPYEISAIGDANTLEAALKSRDGLVGIYTEWGIGMHIEKSEKLLIRGYEGFYGNEFAKTAAQEIS